MSIRQAIAGAIWGAIVVIALQFASAPAFAHGVHTPHPHDVMAAAHKAAKVAAYEEAASRLAEPGRQPAIVSTASKLDLDIVITCTGGCCGTGHGCGAVMNGAAAELPDLDATARPPLFAAERQSGIDPDGLARPPRPLAS